MRQKIEHRPRIGLLVEDLLICQDRLQILELAQITSRFYHDQPRTARNKGEERGGTQQRRAGVCGSVSAQDAPVRSLR